jgi:hypothetical protein
LFYLNGDEKVTFELEWGSEWHAEKSTDRHTKANGEVVADLAVIEQALVACENVISMTTN